MRKWMLLHLLALGLTLAACGPHSGVYVRVGPPAPRYGVVGFAPGPGYVWADGYWDWHGGNWVWIDGRWQHPPRGHTVWVPGHWVQTGHGWRFTPGHWR